MFNVNNTYAITVTNIHPMLRFISFHGFDIYYLLVLFFKTYNWKYKKYRLKTYWEKIIHVK